MLTLSKINSIINSFLSREKSFAFSLVELLMALLVASLLLAALAPVMTRKFTDNVNINGLGDPVKAPADIQCYPYDPSRESVDVTLNDVYYANFIIASAGGGGAGATNTILSNPVTVTKTATEIKTDAKEYDEQIIKITENMTNLKIASLMGAGGGGGGGAGYIRDCTAYGNGKTDTVGKTGKDFAASDLNGLCVTKFNQTDVSGCTSSNTTSSCSQSSTSGMPYVYSGCNRLVCSYQSAINACSNLAKKTGDAWRLPLKEDAAKWAASNTALKVTDIWKALSFCNQNVYGTVPLCTHTSLNTMTNIASWPCYIWSQSATGNFCATTETSNAFGDHSSTYQQYYFSARCVLGPIYKNFSGSAGGRGSVLSNINIPKEYLNQAGYDGQIVLRAGRAGAGGTGRKAIGSDANAVNGGEGYRSCVYIQKKPATGTYGDTVYALCAYGGKGGNGAKASLTGGSNGATLGAYSYCREYTNGNWHDISCTSTNGKATGVGGTSEYKAGDIINANSGGNGAGGTVKIIYQNEFQAAGGGGGGGGSVAHIKNIYVGKNSECNFVIGKGGKGGNVNSNGEDGGMSSVKCNSDARKLEVTGGSGGKIGTAAASLIAVPVGGKNGEGGKISDDIYNNFLPDNRDIKTAVTNTDDIIKMSGNKNKGGRGGISGIGTFGGCGGLYEELNICEVSDTDAGRINGRGFNIKNEADSMSTALAPTSVDIQNGLYGRAGAGGGGGGWERKLGSGTGGEGMHGYVCVYWYGE